jgi:hypothetical protein
MPVSILTPKQGQIDGPEWPVMNDATVFWWFELMAASLICSKRRGEVPLEADFELRQCYFILGGHEEVVLLLIMYTT